jgi:iron(III) transport system substrate-binding protein
MKAFTEDTGVKGEYTRISTAKFVATAITEFEAGKLMADVVQAPLPVLELLKEKGVLSDRTARRPLPGIRNGRARTTASSSSASSTWPSSTTRSASSRRTCPSATRTWPMPKWKDKIVMANPANHATTISWLIGLKENVFKSEAEWMTFVRGLAANKPMFVASFGPTPAPIESGEKLIGISMPKYIITKAPAPLDWARLSQPLIGTPRAIAVTAKAPHPNAARAFVDYWLSKKSMEILAKDVGEYVLAPGVFPPIDGMDKAKVIAIRELSDDEIEKWGAEFKKIFAVK